MKANHHPTSAAPIAIIGSYTTAFGELWSQSLSDLMSEAMQGAIDAASVSPDSIEAVFVGNKAADSFESQHHLNALASSLLPHTPPAFHLEAACASGSLALVTAEMALRSSTYRRVLVVGVEKMSDVSVEEATRILAGAAHGEEEYGSTFPGLYALLSQLYQAEYGISDRVMRQALSQVSAKNHASAIDNPTAQFRRAISADQVTASPMVAKPLRVLDCSPLSDGASALVLELADQPGAKSTSSSRASSQVATILSFGHAQDKLVLAERKEPHLLTATTRASQQALAQASLSLDQIKVAEVHDCFTIAELLAVEDLGLVPRGRAAKAIAKTGQYRSDLIINPSGGLKACGHPVGATGIKQVAFLANWLTNHKDTPFGLTHNVGGTGATAIVHILAGPAATIKKKP